MSKRPNIVLFAAEDLDYEGVNCYDASQTGYTGVIRSGNEEVRDRYEVDELLTPAIDSLAGDGFRSENYYCASAICTPARYSMLTGRYPERNTHFCEMYPKNTQANIFFNIGMTRDETNIAKVLRSNGYRTGMTGKWHNYPQDVKLRLVDMNTAIPPDADPRDPPVRKAVEAWYRQARDYLQNGFGWDSVERVYFDNPEPWNPKEIGVHNIEWIVEGALEFLDGSKGSEQPFFLYVPVTVPHSRYNGKQMTHSNPLATPSGLLDEPPDVMMPRDEIVRRVKEARLPEFAQTGLWLDEGVNAVLGKLDEMGVADDTCFIFTTDHPTAGKETCHLGRIPLIVRWPGHVKPGTVSDELLGQVDLAPTVLDIAGCAAPEDMLQDGQSFRSLLTGEVTTSSRDSVLLEVVNSRAIVKGKWKYIANRLPEEIRGLADVGCTGWFGSMYYDNRRIRQGPPHNADKLFPSYFCEDQLYNLESDPLEQRNLMDDPQYQDVIREMRDTLCAKLASLPHPFGELCRSAE